MLLVFLQTALSATEIPSSAEARAQYWEHVRQPLRLVIQQEAETLIQHSSVQRVQYRVITELDVVYQLFLLEQNGEFPVLGAGNYIIKRNRADGAYEQVKIFLLPDRDFFVRIFPGGDSYSMMDVVIAGDAAHSSIRVPMSFDRILQVPFSWVQEATSWLVNWEAYQLSDDLGAYGRLQAIAEQYGNNQSFEPLFLPASEEARRIELSHLRREAYLVACREPGSILSGVIVDSLRDDAPPLTAGELVVFPYVDQAGAFRMISFVGGEFVSIHSLIAQFPNAWFLLRERRPDSFVFWQED